VLSPAPGGAQLMPRDHALRVPLGSLLLLLWVQGAQRELQHGSAALGGKAQAASGDVWPSLSVPPAAAASAGVGGGAPCARTLAVQARLGQQPSTQLSTARQRRRLLQYSLPTLLRLAGAGAERLYSSELDRLGLLLCPDALGAARLSSRGLSPLSLSAALGLWHAQPAAALPVAALLPALRAALVEVSPPAPSPLPPAPRHVGAPGGAAALAAGPAAAARGGGAASMGLAVLPSGHAREHSSSGTMLHDAAPGAPGGVRLVGSRRRTIVLREAQLLGGSLQIVDCHACYIYVLAPLRCAELLGCCGCTVLLGAVEAVVSLLHCERLRLHCATRALRLHNCLDTCLALCVATPPLLWGDNHRLTLAPLHTAYAGLAAHLATASLSPHLEHNYWSRPLHLSHELSAAPAADATTGDAPPPHAPPPHAPQALAPSPHAPSPHAPPPHASLPEAGGADERVVLLPPHKLTPFHVPVDVPAGAAQGQGTAPVCELPAEYAAALRRSSRKLDDFRAEVEALDASAPLKQELQRTLQSNFKEWLQRSGNLRQLHDLMAISAQPDAPEGVSPSRRA